MDPGRNVGSDLQNCIPLHVAAFWNTFIRLPLSVGGTVHIRSYEFISARAAHVPDNCRTPSCFDCNRAQAVRLFLTEPEHYRDPRAPVANATKTEVSGG